MPTARELLDQADAMMRRNRKRGKGRLGDVPTLTDALDTARDATLPPTLILPSAETAADPIAIEGLRESEAGAAALADVVDPMPLDTLADLPVLTDVVLDWPPAIPNGAGQVTEKALESASKPSDAAIVPESLVGAGLPERPEDPNLPASSTEAVVAEPSAVEPATEASANAGDAFPASAAEAEAAASALPPPAVLEREAEDVSGPAQPQPADAEEAAHRAPDPNAAAAPRVPFLDDDFILEIPPSDDNATAQVAPPAVPAIDPRTLSVGSREWDALAEEIRMQVLQRLDLFTDTGLREQLGARLSPIVERASAQLIETINRELGELVRGYVAEAIEREIDSWRNQNAPKAE